MNIDLTGKQAIVCGATQGMGRAIAMQFAKSGASVILVARNKIALQQVRDRLSCQLDQKHDYMVADFSEPKILERKLNDKISTMPPIHILVNIDGTPPSGSLLETKASDILAAFKRFQICFHILAQAVVPGMKREKYGRIINITTATTKQPEKIPILSMLGCSVACWAKVLANELTPFGITVNNLLPGSIQTDTLVKHYQKIANDDGVSYEEMIENRINAIPAKRFGEPEEIAYAVAFLASSLAGYISGTELRVDGGRIKCLL